MILKRPLINSRGEISNERLPYLMAGSVVLLTLTVYDASMNGVSDALPLGTCFRRCSYRLAVTVESVDQETAKLLSNGATFELRVEERGKGAAQDLGAIEMVVALITGFHCL